MQPEPSGSIACTMLRSDGRAIADRIIAANARGGWKPMDAVYMDCTADTFIDKPAFDSRNNFLCILKICFNIIF